MNGNEGNTGKDGKIHKEGGKKELLYLHSTNFPPTAYAA